MRHGQFWIVRNSWGCVPNDGVRTRGVRRSGRGESVWVDCKGSHSATFHDDSFCISAKMHFSWFPPSELEKGRQN